jgi:hypothetical protein
VTHLAGTNFDAICPANLSHLDKSLSIVPHLDAPETLPSVAAVTLVDGTAWPMTHLRDA